MNTLLNYGALLREILFPAGCAVCGTPLVYVDEARYGLCPTCRAAFTVEAGRRCGICGKPLVSEIDVCMDCRDAPPRTFDRVLAIFPYAGDGKKLLSSFKFGKNRAAGIFLAEKLAEGTRILLEEIDHSAKLEHPALVPVPPRPGKLKHEGWDQIDFIAGVFKKMGKRGALPPVRRCLKRLRSKSQKKLDKRGRRLNLTGRIQCAKTAPREVILFDDVYTTGATMDACAASLKQSGAEKVFGVCLFYS
jgi:ComF family protein